jgi:sulfate permease, SulP family
MHTPASSTPSLDRGLSPKLLDSMHGYRLRHFKADALAGLTVAIVALPLSIALSIASGLPPERGIFTAIVGGFLISLLGGSRFQIGGPAGAFIVLIASIVERHGYEGLVLATAMAGLMMIAAGLLRLGSWIRLMPHPVIIGFTSAIAVIIFMSQLRELLGLELVGEPSALLPKLAALWAALGSFRPLSFLFAMACIVLTLGLRHFRPAWPVFLIAVVFAACIVALLGLDVATIGTRFGTMPSALPLPVFPEVTAAKLMKMLPDALAIALLGCVESLLSAVVAGRMSGDRHRPNAELLAQGVANIAVVIFGGFCVTGTIARTATNVRTGATGPVSGMLHAVYLFAFLVVAAPLVSSIPLAALAAILAIVAWNMADIAEFRQILVGSWQNAVIMLATFGLTLIFNLLAGLGAGIVLALVLSRFKLKT